MFFGGFLNQYGGAASGVTSIVMNTNYASAAIAFSNQAVRADISIKEAGDVGRNTNIGSTAQGSYTDIGDWVSDKTGFPLADSTFEFNAWDTGADTLFGSTTHANNTTFSNLTVDLNWYTYLSSGPGTTACQITFTIREKANTSNTDTTDLILETSSEP